MRTESFVPAPRHEQALEVARSAGAEALLAADPRTVAWLSGYAREMDAELSPGNVTPMLLLMPNEPPTLIVAEDEVATAAAGGCRTVAYPGLGLAPLDAVAGAVRAVKRTSGGRRVATEVGYLPVAVAQVVSWVDASASLTRARAVKDADEIERLRAAIHLCDVGQQRIRERAAAGMTELELWMDLRAALEGELGGPATLVASLVSGRRTAAMGGPPGERALQEGDLVLCDLVPRRNGYWGDSCATFAIGEPTPSVRARHRAVGEALARGIEAIRPGLTAGELDACVRAGLDYPHHSGHGLGTSWHEEPRIVPGAEMRLAPGMVLALEPASYGDGEGLRLEQVVLVTEVGGEILSHHRISLGGGD